MDPCPTADDLIGFLDEALPPDRQESLADHVDRCSACQRHLDRLTDDPTGRLARGPDHTAVLARRDPFSPPTSPLRSIAPTAAEMPAVPGFEMVAEIGRGGMGVVYLARHLRLNRTTALKMVLAGTAADPTVVQRFLFEAEVLARVRHPQVVQVYEVDTYRGVGGVPIPYLAMEYLDGGTLHTFAKRHAPLPPADAAGLIEGLARALHAVHLHGVVHRDLKPANVLRAADDGTFKVTDFGLAKLTDGAGADLTASGVVVGTPAYMAPEQAAGVKQPGPTADVYSLGAILYELLTGRAPYVGTEQMSVLLQVVRDDPLDVQTVRPGVPRGLAAVVMKALARDPTRRFASAAEFADDLRRFLDGRPVLAHRVGTVERARLWVRRNPVVAGLLALLGAVTVAGVGNVLAQWVRAEENAANEREARQEAEDEKIRAQVALGQAVAARRQAALREATLEFDQGVSWCETGEIDRGLKRFARAVELADENGDLSLARVGRVNLAAWQAELPPRRLSLQDTRLSRSVTFSPDGTLLLTGSADSKVRAWDPDTGRLRATFEAGLLHRGKMATWLCSLWSVAASPDNRFVAAGGSDGRVWLWKIPPLGGRADPPAVPTRDVWPAGTSADVWAVTFDRAGRLWAGCGDGTVRVWDVSGPDRRLAGEFRAPLPKAGNQDVHALVVSAEGSSFYTGDRVGHVRAWDVAAKASRLVGQHAGWVQDVALSPDGRRLASSGTDGTVRVWDLDAPGADPKAEAVGGGAAVTTLAFGPDGRHLVVGEGDGNVRVWDVGTGLWVGAPARHGGDARKLRFRPGTGTFAVASAGPVEVFALPARLATPVGVPEAAGGSRGAGFDHLAFAPDGGRLLAVQDRVPVLFDLRDGRPTYPEAKRVAAAVFRPGGSEVFTFGDGFRTLDPATRSVRSDDFLGDWKVSGAVADPRTGGAVVAADRAVFAWAGPGHPPRGPLRSARTAERVTATAAHPARPEVFLAVGRRVEFVHPETGAATRPGFEATDDVYAAAYSPNGQRLLLGHRNNAAEVHDLTGGAAPRELRHLGPVVGVAWAPDGSVVLTGSRDGTARFWDPATGLPLGPSLRHPAPVTSVAYAPDGKRVATASRSRQTNAYHLFLWPTPPAP